MDKDEESGHGTVQMRRDLRTNRAGEQSPGERLVLNDGHVVFPGNLLDAIGHEPLALGHDLGRSHRQRVVLEGHGESGRVGDYDVGGGHRVHHSSEGHLPGAAAACSPDQRVAL